VRHEELLAEVNKDIDQTPLVKDYYPVRALLALRAVVELHQPMEQSETEICEECTRISLIRIKYPCRTIQNIRKELK
jgi:hypothetical protein